MVAGGWRRSPGGQRFAPVEEVGSRCNIEGLRQQTLLMGGGCRIEGLNEKIQENG